MFTDLTFNEAFGVSLVFLLSVVAIIGISQFRQWKGGVRRIAAVSDNRRKLLDLGFSLRYTVKAGSMTVVTEAQLAAAKLKWRQLPAHERDALYGIMCLAAPIFALNRDLYVAGYHTGTLKEFYDMFPQLLLDEGIDITNMPYIDQVDVIRSVLATDDQLVIPTRDDLAGLGRSVISLEMFREVIVLEVRVAKVRAAANKVAASTEEEQG